MPGSMRYGIFRLVQETVVNMAGQPPATRARAVLGGTLDIDSTTAGDRLVVPLPPGRAVP
jgi:hypothetical protein